MLTGLTDEQVNERIAEGKVNADENPNTRTYKQIIREKHTDIFQLSEPCTSGACTSGWLL